MASARSNVDQEQHLENCPPEVGGASEDSVDLVGYAKRACRRESFGRRDEPVQDIRQQCPLRLDEDGGRFGCMSVHHLLLPVTPSNRPTVLLGPEYSERWS